MGFGFGRGCFGREGVQSCTGTFPGSHRRPVHPFVVHRPALPAQQAVGHAKAPADVLGGYRSIRQGLCELAYVHQGNAGAGKRDNGHERTLITLLGSPRIRDDH